MGRYKWDAEGKRLGETGVDQGMLYVMGPTGLYGTGEGWDGLTSVSENPEGAEDQDFYADNIKYLTLKSEEEFKATIGCYSYPDGFKKCCGENDLGTGLTLTAQARSKFAFTYRTKIANDVKGLDLGYKIHIVYGCQAGVTQRDHNTINESPEIEEMSFDVSATKQDIGKDYKKCSHFIIDSRTADPDKLEQLENMLYGYDGYTPETGDPVPETDPTVPTPEALVAMFKPAG